MRLTSYEILGDAIVREMQDVYEIGAAGFDASFLADTAAELAKRGIATYNEGEARKASAAEVEAKSQAAISADAIATAATAQALFAAMVAKDSAALAQVRPSLAPKAAADQAALDAAQLAATQAQAAQDAAAVGLPPEAVAKRLKAANDVTAKATADYTAAAQAYAKVPADSGKKLDAQLKQARAQAAQATAAKAAAIVAKTPGAAALVEKSSEPSFFKRMVGPLPVWGWGITAVGVAGVGYGLVKLLRRK